MQTFAQLSVSSTGERVEGVACRKTDLVEKTPELLVQLPVDHPRSKAPSEFPCSYAGVGDEKFAGREVGARSVH